MNNTGFFIAPKGLSQEYPSHVQWSGANRMLSAPECTHIIEQAETAGWRAGTIGSATSNREDPGYRRVDVCSATYSKQTEWLYERLSQKVPAANEQYFGFDVVGLMEEVQILRYTAPEVAGEPAGHYDWHQDFGSGYMGRRKLSVVVQLSDGADYEGCELTLMTHKMETMRYRGAGEGVIFPSWTPHCVSNITRGTRYALVAWVHGSPFR